jgi:ATP-dependent DNA ligase
MDLLQTEDGLDLIIPMKAVGTSKDKLKAIIASPLWTCDIKLDGHFFIGYINQREIEGLNTRFFSRNVSVETGVFYERTPHLKCISKEADRKFSDYGSMIVTGELCHFLGKDTVTSVVGGNPDHAWMRQEELGKPVYCLFDILEYDGDWIGDYPLRERKELLHTICHSESIDPMLTNDQMKSPTNLLYLTPTLEILQSHIAVCGTAFNKSDMWDYSLENGFEGLVHKRLDSIYDPGYISADKVRVRGSKDWIKQKVKRSFDVVILGFTEANYGVTGQFEGMVGAVKFGQYKSGELIEIGQASGFNVDTRRDMTDNPEKYIGKVALIEAQERSSARDRLRHAQYKELRDDKNPEECIYDEDEC